MCRRICWIVTRRLLRYPPQNALQRYFQFDTALPEHGISAIETGELSKRPHNDFIQTWSVCTYTNMINTYATNWKNRYCDNPNPEPSFKYPDRSMGFFSDKSPMKEIMRKGGWTDIDYKPGLTAAL